MVAGDAGEAPWRPASPLIGLVYRYVVHAFFSSWRNAGLWRVREGWPDNGHRDQGIDGACDRRGRVIYLAPPRTSSTRGDPLAVATLIHELVHATTSADHDDAFRHRLQRAAARADELGAAELHALLLRDLANCDKAAWTEDERRVYAAASDAMMRLGPTATIEELEAHLRQTVPGLPPSMPSLRDSYPSFERVFQRELQRVSELLAPRASPWSPRGD